jgi:hypothetical protein
MNSQWHYIDYGDVFAITPSGIRVKFGNANQNNNYNRTLYIKNSNLNGYIKDTEIRISFIFHNKELSYETIGIINNGIKGEDGKDGTAPSLVKTTILGYSLDENANEDEGIDTIGGVYSDWVLSIDELGTLEPCTTIYILNQYEWSDGSITRGITVTLSGTQGIEGKSRILFYLGSYERGKATLSKSIPTVFNDIRCDYYIDAYGNAWMRKGKKTNGEESDNAATKTVPSGSGLPNDYWEASTKVGFLQAGAITADMINTGSITADSAFVTTLFSSDITANNLTVNVAQIEGRLTVDNIDTTGLTISSGNIIDGAITETKISGGAITTGKIAVGAITADKIAVGAITADKIESKAITADKIDATDLSVCKLNTKPDGNTSSVVIQNNEVVIKDDVGNDICIFSDNSIGDEDYKYNVNMNDAFKDMPRVTLKYTGKSYGLNPDLMLANNFNIDTYTYTISYIKTTEGDTINVDRKSNYNEIDINPRILLGGFLYEKKLKSNKIVNISLSYTAKIDATTLYETNTNENTKLYVTEKPCIKVYRKNGSNPILIEDELTVSTTTIVVDRTSPNESIIYNDVNFNFTTTEEDEYYIELYFDTHYYVDFLKNGGTDLIKHSIENCYVSFTFGVSDNRRTILYKDGILVQNEMNGMLICNEGILLKFNNFGIKIDDTGIKYSKNLLNYQNNLNKATWNSLIQ